MTDSFTEKSNTYVSWLEESGVTISPKLRLEDKRSEGQGRCVVAIEDISEDELLFEIPRSLLLNCETSQLTTDFPKAVKQFEKYSDEPLSWEPLILCMFYEIYILQQKSKWWPYFCVLPEKEELNGLVLWLDEELDNLKPSYILSSVGKEQVRNMYNTLLKFIEESEYETLKNNIEKLDWNTFLRIGSVILAYSFDVGKEITGQNTESTETKNAEEFSNGDDEEEEEEEEEEEDIEIEMTKSMVPLADTLNADTKKCNSNLLHSEKTLKMIAIKPITKGEQVYNTYGELSNAELLRRYGFVEWDGSYYDCGEVSKPHIHRVLKKTFQVETDILNKLDDLIDKNEKILDLFDEFSIVQETFLFESDGEIPFKFLFYVQVYTLLLQNPRISKLGPIALDKYLNRSVDETSRALQENKITEKALEVVKLALENRMKEYEINLDDIEKSFIPVSADKDIKTKRKQMAEFILVSEFKALRECSKAILEKFDSIRDVEILANMKDAKNEERRPKKRVRR
ncbi:ribosomal lysine N-methyltransferase RNJ42_01681 [Nakaseomyces bracarensis]|uniref:ribosomal lysine N-methyltransferase n=1 Tax=Nakaseomyces bracarensis TaxID=273131 RepID=UPI003871A7CA